MDIVGNGTLRDLLDDLVRRSGARVFLVFEDADGRVTRYTYEQFGEQVARAANLFAGLGVRKADAVAVHLRNCPELIVALFGLASIGAVCVPLHARSTEQECAGAIARVRARVVVCEEAQREFYGPGRIEADHVVVARGAEPLPGTVHFDSALAAQEARLARRVELSSDDPASILFTSGTTAQPKGVVLTHANMLFSGIFVDWQAAMSAEDRLLTTMPACHVNFQLNALMPVLTLGATLVLVERYSATRFWHQVVAHRATVVQSIAMMVRTQLMQPPGDWERDNRVREVLYYLPIADEEKEEFERRFATRILNSYGTSESLVGAITDPPHGERRWPSIGRVGLGYEARIALDDGREAATGQVGEIQIRGIPGRTLMKEYLDDPEATAALYDSDGWMHTGDLGRVDDGWFYFLDRRSQLIKRAGENVAPAEVEAVLAAHPRVQEAAVIGVPDPVYDQAVKAFVVPVAGARIAAEEIRAFCADRLAAYKVPAIVAIVDSLPQTGSYKVAKSSLK